MSNDIKLDQQQSAFLEGFLETGTLAGGARKATGREIVGQEANDFADRMIAGTPMRSILPSIYVSAGFNPQALIERLVDTAMNASITVRLNKFETEERPDYKARNEATELLFKMLGAFDTVKAMKSKTQIFINQKETPLGDSPFEGGDFFDGESTPIS